MFSTVGSEAPRLAQRDHDCDRLRRAPSRSAPLAGCRGVGVQEEPGKGGVVGVVGVDPAVLLLPVHLQPDLVPGLQAQYYGARGLVQVVLLELVEGEHDRFVIPVQADPGVPGIDGEVKSLSKQMGTLAADTRLVRPTLNAERGARALST
ncbi:hypothetical protein SKAU_G00198460 [Synaphobranchus kaupii]|uniref:Uncharacterized protein n=1 Tax=Synaphobranchus kaupii TaxID=118154 RepID=A0A9Q1IVW0_SYNKA|nr:hypothetical protein SKAU_G00198460 [Synaphobranchus kaupii]